MKVTINVTEDDIRGASPGCYKCPIARAMTRTLNHPIWISWRSWGYGGSLHVAGDLPKEASNFIDRFDFGIKTLGPISFEVEVNADFHKYGEVPQ